MKLLELPIFEQINALLTQERQNCYLESKIESYSCKMVADDKKLLRELSSGCVDQTVPLSPPEKAFLQSCPSNLSPSPLKHGHLSSDEDSQTPLASVGQANRCCVKTHFYLVSTLNKSFYPDYDFSCSPSTDFCRELSVTSAVNTVDNLLLTLGGNYYSSFKPRLWEEVDREISLKECEIYKYSPLTDLNCGPFGEPGVLWSFNYFFYNRRLKRIVFISCIARTGPDPSMDPSLEVIDQEEVMEEEDEGDAPQFYQEKQCIYTSCN